MAVSTLNTRLALIVAAFFVGALALQLMPTKSGIEKEQISETVQRLKPVQAQEVVQMIAESRGMPVMLFVYASWCPHCRASMDALEELASANELTGIKTVFLSADTDFTQLAEYIILNHYDQMFEPYVLKRSGVKTPAEIFRAFGGNFTGGIPYFAFFRRDNSLAREFAGRADTKTLRKFLKEVKQTPEELEQEEKNGHQKNSGRVKPAP